MKDGKVPDVHNRVGKDRYTIMALKLLPRGKTTSSPMSVARRARAVPG